MIGLGLRLGITATLNKGGGWSPARDGATAWFDFQSLGTLFTDTARTIPASVVGDPIRGVSDKSGNGNHASEATSPGVLDSIGNYPAIKFDGIAQLLRANSIAAGQSGDDTPFTAMWVEYDTDDSVALQTRWSFGSSSTANPRFAFDSDAAGSCSVRKRDDATSGAANTLAIGAGGEERIQRWIVRHNGSTVDVWLNGVQVKTASAQNVGTQTFDKFTMGAQSRLTNDSFYGGLLLEQAVWINHALTDEQIAKGNAYLERRYSVEPPVVVVTPVPGNYALVAGIGQSNREGRGTAGASAQPIAGTAYFYDGTRFSVLSDPVGGALSGSAAPAFAKQYNAITGRKVFYLELATGGTGQVVGSNPNWDITGTLYPAARDAINAAVTAIQALPGVTIATGIVLDAQGENDAERLDAGTITAAAYKSSKQAMYEALKAACPIIDKIFISELGARLDGTKEASYAAIRSAQADVVAALPSYCAFSFREAKNYPAQSKQKDTYHYNQVGLNQMGYEEALNVSIAQGYNPLPLTAYWDLDDAATVFQDTSRTTPATTAGQSVKGVSDKSGNGHHLTEATNAPVLGSVGAYKAAEFAGAQYLSANGIAPLFSGEDVPFTISWVEYDTDSAGATETRFAFGRSTTSVPRLQFFGDATGATSLVKRDDANSIVTVAMGAGAENLKQHWVLRHSGTTVEAWLNGVKVKTSTAQDRGVVTFDRFAIGAQIRNTIDSFFVGKMVYGKVWAGSALPDSFIAAEIAAVASRYP
jgi:hypothetical protein